MPTVPRVHQQLCEIRAKRREGEVVQKRGYVPYRRHVIISTAVALVCGLSFAGQIGLNALVAFFVCLAPLCTLLGGVLFLAALTTTKERAGGWIRA